MKVLKIAGVCWNFLCRCVTSRTTAETEPMRRIAAHTQDAASRMAQPACSRNRRWVKQLSDFVTRNRRNDFVYFSFCKTLTHERTLWFVQYDDDIDWVLQSADFNNDLTAGESAPNRDHTTNSNAGHYLTVTTKRPNFKGTPEFW